MLRIKDGFTTLFQYCFTKECNTGMLTRDNTLFTHIDLAHAFAMKKLFITRALATAINNYGRRFQKSSCPYFLSALQLACGDTRPGYGMFCYSAL